MATISIVECSKLEGSIRLDAQFYQEKYFFTRKRISDFNCVRLGDIASTFRKGIFDIKASLYCENGIPFIRISNLKEGLIDDSEIVHIPNDVHLKEFNTALTKGDIVLSKTAYPAASLITLNECNTSQDTIAIKIKDFWKNKLFPGYIVAFLNSCYGLLLLEQWFQGNIQMHLALPDAKRILIPILSEDFQLIIDDIWWKASEKSNSSKHFFEQAEQLLLSELGLHDWKPQHTLTYVKSFSKVVKASRMDAEYFQPKYDEVLTYIARFSPKPITSFGTQVLETVKLYENNVYRYIEISDVNTATGEVGFTERSGKELPANAKIKVLGGELIVSKVRPTRGAVGIIPNECRDSGVCSSAFVVLKVPSPAREFLQVYLRSPIGKTLLEKPCKGTSYPTIGDNDVKMLPIPTITPSKIRQISHLVQQSHAARREAKTLLEKAKRAVEIAIEYGEQQAMDFLCK